MGTHCQDKHSHKQPGWACPYRGVAAKYFRIQSCSMPGHPVPVSCADGPRVFLVSVFPMAQGCTALSQPQSHHQHVCPVQPPWVTWLCGVLGAALLSSGISPGGIWFAVRLQEGNFLPGLTESAPLGMMWQCRGCRKGIARSSYSQC